jgi:enoyl-CoA hydratase
VDEGRVVVVGLNRPHARNAVDRPTAEALTRALREELEADPRAKVGVLHGIGGTFCAGADLKAISPGESEEEAGGDQREGSIRRNRLLPHGDGPMGPTRLLLSKPVIAAISGASFKPNPLFGGWR